MEKADRSIIWNVISYHEILIKWILLDSYLSLNMKVDHDGVSVSLCHKQQYSV